MHGGGPKVVPGRPIPEEYKNENLELLEKGFANLLHHINTVKKSGIVPVVCINVFHTDTKDEIKLLRKLVEQEGVRCAVSEHWLKGGEGALELTDAVLDACNEKVNFKFLYPLEMPLRERIETIAKEVYGADGVTYTPEAEAKAKKIEENPQFKDFATMMVKTHLSLSHNPDLKGVPKGWVLPVRDFLIFAGAKFICPCTGTISLMPGTSSDPAFRRVDVDVNTGKVIGLF
jgi:formate--tetrahydrofolate ligase